MQDVDGAGDRELPGADPVFDTRIPHTVKVGESIYYSMPVEQYSPKASAGIAYGKFAEELISIEN